jgi:hypothetical protein
MAISGFVALLVAIVAARIINERGYRTLSAEEKLRLMDGFSAQRAYSLIPMVLLVAAYFLLSTKTSLDPTMLAIGYFGLLVVYVVIRAILNHRKMKTLGMPDKYRRYFVVSQLLSMLGLAWFAFSMLDLIS